MAEALKQNNKLEKVFLDGNNIGDEGAKSLAHALMANHTLQRIDLDLDANNISNKGVKFLAEALKVNTTLEEIYLDDNKIGDRGQTLGAYFNGQ